MYLLFTFWSKWWIHSKKTQHISTGFWLDKLLKKSQLNHNVSTNYIPPCPQWQRVYSGHGHCMGVLWGCSVVLCCIEGQGCCETHVVWWKEVEEGFVVSFGWGYFIRFFYLPVSTVLPDLCHGCGFQVCSVVSRLWGWCWTAVLFLSSLHAIICMLWHDIEWGHVGCGQQLLDSWGWYRIPQV